MVSISTDSAIGIIASLIVLGFLIANGIYLYNVIQALKVGTVNSNLSKTSAEALLAIDIILAIIVFIYLIYKIWRLVQSGREEEIVYEMKTMERPKAVAVGPPGCPEGCTPTVRSPAAAGGPVVAAAVPSAGGTVRYSYTGTASLPK